MVLRMLSENCYPVAKNGNWDGCTKRKRTTWRWSGQISSFPADALFSYISLHRWHSFCPEDQWTRMAKKEDREMDVWIMFSSCHGICTIKIHVVPNDLRCISRLGSRIHFKYNPATRPDAIKAVHSSDQKWLDWLPASSEFHSSVYRACHN